MFNDKKWAKTSTLDLKLALVSPMTKLKTKTSLFETVKQIKLAWVKIKFYALTNMNKFCISGMYI